MMNRTRIAIATMLLALASACHKDDRAEKLKALEKAYKAGVFTKEEYEAKKAALGPDPAASDSSSGSSLPQAGFSDPALATPDPSAAPPGLSISGSPPGSSPDTPPPASTPAAPPPIIQKPKAAPPPSQPKQNFVPPPASNPTPPAATPPPPPTSTNPPRPAPKDDEEPATVGGCRDERPGGPTVQERYYPATLDRVRRAAVSALESLDFDVKTNTPHEIDASKRRHLSAVVGAGGEKLTLKFKSSARGTGVWAETKKSFMGKLAQKSWTGVVLAQIDCNLKK